MANKIQESVLLAPYTTYRIGGPADYFVVAKSRDELIKYLDYAKAKNLPVTILGGGSNVLISDRGIRGLTIINKATNYHISGKILNTESGSILQKIARQTLDLGLSGLEFGANIPGTIGGAVVGNAGAYGRSMSDSFLEASCWTREKGIVRYQKKDLGFDYRKSILKNNRNIVVLDVTIKLERGNPEKLLSQLRADSKKRSCDFRGLNCGCYFTNPENMEISSNNKVVRNPSAGQLIDLAGLKNYSVGGARVSENHANVILNTGEAQANEVLELEGIISDKVEEKYGISLKAEVTKIGDF
jgi:UDP-N-acetylmuramate dehydrogenase